MTPDPAFNENKGGHLGWPFLCQPELAPGNCFKVANWATLMIENGP
jgi:hypothetical protein